MIARLTVLAHEDEVCSQQQPAARSLHVGDTKLTDADNVDYTGGCWGAGPGSARSRHSSMLLRSRLSVCSSVGSGLAAV